MMELRKKLNLWMEKEAHKIGKRQAIISTSEDGKFMIYYIRFFIYHWLVQK
jgi:hypothetical protein